MSAQTRDCVAAWIRAHQDSIGGPPIKSVRHEEPGFTLVVWFETSKYLIDISSWEHANCLDILALDKATGTTDYVATGPCEGTAGLIKRLDNFLSWLDLNEPNRRQDTN